LRSANERETQITDQGHA